MSYERTPFTRAREIMGEQFVAHQGVPERPIGFPERVLTTLRVEGFTLMYLSDETVNGLVDSGLACSGALNSYGSEGFMRNRSHVRGWYLVTFAESRKAPSAYVPVRKLEFGALTHIVRGMSLSGKPMDALSGEIVTESRLSAVDHITGRMPVVIAVLSDGAVGVRASSENKIPDGARALWGVREEYRE